MKQTNSHLSSDYRLEKQPDMSQMTTYVGSHNVALTRERDLDRYTPAFSDRTNIFDNARTVSPANYFGTKFIRNVDPRVRYFPAGMNFENSRKITGEPAFPQYGFKKRFPQNI